MLADADADVEGLVRACGPAAFVATLLAWS